MGSTLVCRGSTTTARVGCGTTDPVTMKRALGVMCRAIRLGWRGGINTYAYVGGNPVSRIDPFGLTQCDIDVAFAFAKTMNPHIKLGAGAPKADYRAAVLRGRHNRGEVTDIFTSTKGTWMCLIGVVSIIFLTR